MTEKPLETGSTGGSGFILWLIEIESQGGHSSSGRADAGAQTSLFFVFPLCTSVLSVIHPVVHSLKREGTK